MNAEQSENHKEESKTEIAPRDEVKEKLYKTSNEQIHKIRVNLDDLIDDLKKIDAGGGQITMENIEDIMKTEKALKVLWEAIDYTAISEIAQMEGKRAKVASGNGSTVNRMLRQHKAKFYESPKLKPQSSFSREALANHIIDTTLDLDTGKSALQQDFEKNDKNEISRVIDRLTGLQETMTRHTEQFDPNKHTNEKGYSNLDRTHILNSLERQIEFTVSTINILRTIYTNQNEQQITDLLLDESDQADELRKKLNLS